MTDRLRRLGKETALYGISTVVGRMLNFLLVPLFANLLSPEENGVIATLYSYVAFAVVVYGMGMEQALMRFWTEADEGGRPLVLRRALIAAVVGILISGVLAFAGVPVATGLGFAPDSGSLVALAALILAADNLSAVPFALLRLQHRPLVFVGLKVGNILATLLLTLWFVASNDMGADGVFLANAVASLLTSAVVLAIVYPQVTVRGSPDRKEPLLPLMFRFGLPLVPAGLAGIALQVVDRPILRALTDDSTVGVYQLNYRLGIFMMLAVGMFDFAWRPFFLQHAKDRDAPPLFAHIFTLFSSILAFIFVAVSLFVNDLVRFPLGSGTFFPHEYWEGASIVPVVLLAYVFTGAYVVFLTGVYIQKRTGIVPVIGLSAAALNIVVNILLVPRIGIMGAALAHVFGYGLQAVWMYKFSQRHFRVPYEWTRVVRLWTMAVVIVAGGYALQLEPLSLVGIAVKASLVSAFCVGVFVMRIIRPEEIKTLGLSPSADSPQS